MLVHVQFLNRNVSGEISEALGSDAVFILDGRNKTLTWINDSHNRLAIMRQIHPDYIGFVIKCRNRSNNSEPVSLFLSSLAVTDEERKAYKKEIRL